MLEIRLVTENGTRSRCGDINTLLKEGKISEKGAERLVKEMANRWQPHHPHLTFRHQWVQV